MKQNKPSIDTVVSFLIPTFNAAKYLEECLRSIFLQDYPKDRIEVLIADGGSSDQTLEIANKFPTIILHNSERIAENGKYIAYRKSKGKYIILLDSDNIIGSNSWLSECIMVLDGNNDLDGVESNYLQSNKFTSINKYATGLVIVDPLARMLASRPKIMRMDNHIKKIYPKGSIPVSGANGFIWRRALIEKYVDKKTLHETTLLQKAAQEKDINIGNLPGVGIYHYYCNNLQSYYSKRFKIASKHLQRNKQQVTWVSKRSKIRLYLSTLYLFSIVGPSVEALYNIIKERKLYWLWHPFICFSTASIYTYKYLRSAI